MQEKLYTIEIKAGAFTPFDYSPSQQDPVRLRIISGNILSHRSQSLKFSVGDQIVAYVPKDLYIDILEPQPRQFTMDVPEAYIIKKPQEVSYELAAAGAATGVKALTALHYNLGVLEGESLLIINASDQVSTQLASSLGLTVLQAGEGQQLHQTDLPNAVLQEMGGIGVHHILDFSNSHTHEQKRSIIQCLRPRGKWCVTNPLIQLDPPEAQQLFYRSASLTFLNTELWVEAGIDHGNFLHLLELSLKKLRQAVFEPSIEKIGSFGNVKASETGIVIVKPL